MELGELWKKLDSDKLSKPVLGSVHIQKKSKHPVEKLKNAYLWTTGFSLAFLIGFVVLFFLFDETVVKAGLLFMIVSYTLAVAINFLVYRKVKAVLPIDRSLKEVLSRTHDFITKNIRLQERVALFVYPFAATSGFLMGASMGSGNLMELLESKKVIITLVITSIVLTPFSFYLARWMYKASYGKCLIELKALIDELERPD
jgi:hypothetical protein